VGGGGGDMVDTGQPCKDLVVDRTNRRGELIYWLMGSTVHVHDISFPTGPCFSPT
jgi:hypothetical protein